MRHGYIFHIRCQRINTFGYFVAFSLSFHDIERIQGDKLDWEAYFYNAFWYDDTPDKSSMLWQEEDFPFHMFRFTTIGYNISES